MSTYSVAETTAALRRHRFHRGMSEVRQRTLGHRERRDVQQDTPIARLEACLRRLLDRTQRIGYEVQARLEDLNIESAEIRRLGRELSTIRRGLVGASRKPGPSVCGLSRRQLRIITLMLKGRSYKEIAAALGITVSTIKFHLEGAFRKTGTHDRTSFLIWFLAETAKQLEADGADRSPAN